MTMPGLAANRRPRVVAPRSPRITYSGFYKGGRGARSDSKAADWNYGHRMFVLAVRDPGCLVIVTLVVESIPQTKIIQQNVRLSIGDV